jgi:Kef-type K+ transport system membrane component KefB
LAAAVPLFLFVGIALATAFLALRVQPSRLVAILRKTMHTTAQLPVRLSLLLLAVLFVISGQFGLDSILGAMAAGMIVALLTGSEDGEEVRKRLESIGFGFFVPVFFVVTGLKFDLTALLGSGRALAELPLFLALFLIVRGTPVLLYRRDFAKKDLAALALVSATALPLVVAITEIGVSSERMRADTAAALVGAGMLSVLLYPLIALILRRHAQIAHE